MTTNNNNTATTSAATAHAGGWVEVRLATAAGDANASPAENAATMAAAVSVFLAYWARLAYGGGPTPLVAGTLPPARGSDIIEWARRLLLAAYEAEGEMAPDAYRRVAYDPGWRHPDDAPRVRRVRLGWNGTWTPSRWVDVEFALDDGGEVSAARLIWFSGTGKNSRYLNIEGLLEQLRDVGADCATATGFTDLVTLMDEPFYENV